MTTLLRSILCATLLSWTCAAEVTAPKNTTESDAGKVTSHYQGLHGCIGFGHEKLPPEDDSVVTYSWYRFVDQPSFQQYSWSAEKKAKLQAFVEKLHAQRPTDRDYMAQPTRGKLVSLDPALIVTPPKGLEVGYVPIVTRQAAQ